jgi:Fe-S cluster assembly iron-binding protein IscA
VATKSDAEEMGLRNAARGNPDFSVGEVMEFHEARNDELVDSAEGIALAVSPAHRDRLDGMTIDYYEFEACDFRFIFINPNDAAAAPKGCGTDGRGCSGGGAS